MNNDPMLESYLSEVDSYLSHRLSVSDKSEIVTEIKSHILDSKEKQPQTPMSELLRSMGDPREVANRYLSEKGLAPVPVSQKKNIIKWLVIGFLGTVGLFLLFILILVFKFSPLISVNEESEQVRILGGLVDIDGAKGHISIGDGSGNLNFSFGETKERLTVEGVKTVEMNFVNGDLDVEFSSTQTDFSYSCEYAGKTRGEFKFEKQSDVIKATAVPSLGVDCDLTIPQGVGLILQGQNADVDIQLNPQDQYNIKAEVSVGHMNTPPPSHPQGVPVEVRVSNGEISFN